MVIDDLQNLEVVTDLSLVKGGFRWTSSQQDTSKRSIVYTLGNGAAEAYNYVYSSNSSINGETTSTYYSEQYSSSSS